MLSNKLEVFENRFSGGRTLLKGMNEVPPRPPHFSYTSNDLGEVKDVTKCRCVTEFRENPYTDNRALLKIFTLFSVEHTGL
jgi:hypothetical protein